MGIKGNSKEKKSSVVEGKSHGEFNY